MIQVAISLPHHRGGSIVPTILRKEVTRGTVKPAHASTYPVIIGKKLVSLKVICLFSQSSPRKISRKASIYSSRKGGQETTTDNMARG